MSEKKYFKYEGIHCSSACALKLAGKICQCKFDRLYERQSFEHPEKGLLKMAIPQSTEE